jgi:hypothetical protein
VQARVGRRRDKFYSRSETEPQPHDILNLPHLRRIECPQLPNVFRMRHGDEILCIEHPCSKEYIFTATSKRVPRALVVCATAVAKARSSSRTATLKTRQGRTFAAIPRSTRQTSPRSGAIISHFPPIELQEHVLSTLDQLVIG